MVATRTGEKVNPSIKPTRHCHQVRHHGELEGGLVCSQCQLFFCAYHLLKDYDITQADVSPSHWICFVCDGKCNCSRCILPEAERKRKPNPKRKPNQQSLLFERIKRLEQQLADKENQGIELRAELQERDFNLIHDSTDLEFLCGDQPSHPTDGPGVSVLYPIPAESTGRGIDAETVKSTNAIREKILVMVRLRPFTPRELASKDMTAWECLDEKSIVSRNRNKTRTQTRYTFDKVFDQSCQNMTVYKEGVRGVVLSAMEGINATIIAYGQTSSGKTYTISGITDILIDDIYAHIQKSQSNFTVRFSAIEIYNEHVFDLTRDSTSLSLLDHPKKGTVIKNLAEMVVEDGPHLKDLIAACVAKRKTDETSLNDHSSRSHQIIKLNIGSSHRDASGGVRSLFASLSLVDLAGSESAAETETETDARGTRVKEAGNINTSLLALSQVIGKLSGGKKGEHIGYRDSNLTRILKSSLGGNSRTAVICTLSPALSHVSQSHSTLNFANNAKNVTNSARVNMEVVSDKQSVDYLRKELLNQKQRNQQMETEMLALKCERDALKCERDALKRERDLDDLALSELEKARQHHKKQKGSMKMTHDSS